MVLYIFCSILTSIIVGVGIQREYGFFTPDFAFISVVYGMVFPLFWATMTLYWIVKLIGKVR